MKKCKEWKKKQIKCRWVKIKRKWKSKNVKQVRKGIRRHNEREKEWIEGMKRKNEKELGREKG